MKAGSRPDRKRPSSPAATDAIWADATHRNQASVAGRRRGGRALRRREVQAACQKDALLGRQSLQPLIDIQRPARVGVAHFTAFTTTIELAHHVSRVSSGTCSVSHVQCDLSKMPQETALVAAAECVDLGGQVGEDATVLQV